MDGTISVILFIAFILFLLVMVAREVIQDAHKSTSYKSNRKTNTSAVNDRTEETVIPQNILDHQAKMATKQRQIDDEASIWSLFIHIAAKRLCELWVGFPYEEARGYVKAWLDGADMKFPDSDYDWSPSAAREIAEIIADEDGEHYGDN